MFQTCATCGRNLYPRTSHTSVHRRASCGYFTSSGSTRSGSMAIKDTVGEINSPVQRGRPLNSPWFVTPRSTATACIGRPYLTRLIRRMTTSHARNPLPRHCKMPAPTSQLRRSITESELRPDLGGQMVRKDLGRTMEESSSCRWTHPLESSHSQISLKDATSFLFLPVVPILFDRKTHACFVSWLGSLDRLSNQTSVSSAIERAF